MDWRRRPRVAPASAQRWSDGGWEEPIRPRLRGGPGVGDLVPGGLDWNKRERRLGREGHGARGGPVTLTDALAGMAGNTRIGSAALLRLMSRRVAGLVMDGGCRPGRLVAAVVPRLDQCPAHPRHCQEEEQGNQPGTTEHSQHQA